MNVRKTVSILLYLKLLVVWLCKLGHLTETLQENVYTGTTELKKRKKKIQYNLASLATPRKAQSEKKNKANFLACWT